MIKSNAIVSRFFMVLVAMMLLNSNSHAFPLCLEGHCGRRKICQEEGRPVLVNRFEGSFPSGVVQVEDFREGSEMSQMDNAVSSQVKKDFTGDFYNMLIKPTSELPDNHRIVTNGIQSDNFLTQDEIDLRSWKIILSQYIGLNKLG